ncbi:unnamed protein product [Symbiodinium natans]|uniref:Uncharacterized protein n=1 Tax=Symbiodinium natans TaxID=878477 RepID=A0A812QWW3_9DINO|nr:unnamed protein product [Symbiodinium natans]
MAGQHFGRSSTRQKAFDSALDTAESSLRRLLRWFQPRSTGASLPASRLVAGILIAGDVVLPRLERLQRRVAKLHLRMQRATSLLDDGTYAVADSILEQGSLIAEAAFVTALYLQLGDRRLRTQPRMPKVDVEQEAWVVLLWGGNGRKAERRAFLYSEAIRTLAFSARRAEAPGSRRPFIVLAVGELPRASVQELEADGLEVRDIAEMNQSLPALDKLLHSARHGAGAWFAERGLPPSFPQLAAWALPFRRVVILDADTLVLENCDELFDLGAVAVASGYEIHQEQLDLSRHDGSRTYMINAGVISLRPDPQFLRYMQAVAAADAFRGRVEHYAEGATPTFQQFLDIFLLEASDRRGFAHWDAGRFRGCASRAERGRAGTVWAPIKVDEDLIPSWKLTNLDHCRLPLDFHFQADFAHVFWMTTAALEDAVMQGTSEAQAETPA